MDKEYIIEDCQHNITGRDYLKDPNYYSDFQRRLIEFKNLIINLVQNNEGKSFVHFGDGDYFFLKKQAVGSANPGKRALSIRYKKFNIKPFREGWDKADYHCVEYLEKNNRNMLKELYPNQETIPTEYLYGLTMNKWFFKNFSGKIGLIGAGEKLNIIKKLMEHKEYRDYLCLENFNDYIEIPQKFACDNLDNTIEMVKKQLLNSKEETRIFLYGVGHVKSGLIHHLPRFKKALYIDIGAGIDGIAGLLDHDRPYAFSWINYRLKNYNYSNIDTLNYNYQNDKTLKWI